MWGSLLRETNDLLAFFLGGFVFYGGLLGAAFMIYWYTRKYQMDFMNTIDFLIPSVPLAQCFGRIGCLFAGHCYGKPSSLPFSILFEHSTITPRDERLFPIQIVEALLNLFLCLLLCLEANIKKGLLPAAIHCVMLCFDLFWSFLKAIAKGTIRIVNITVDQAATICRWFIFTIACL